MKTILYLQSSFNASNNSVLDGVSPDAKSIAELAARELLSLGFKTYAYVPFKEPVPWTTNRPDISQHGFEWTSDQMRFYMDGLCHFNEMFTSGHDRSPKGYELKSWEQLPIDYESEWIRLMPAEWRGGRACE